MEQTGDVSRMSPNEEHIAQWRERLSTQIPGWDELSGDAQRILAEIAMVLSEENQMADRQFGWVGAAQVDEAMARLLPRAWTAGTLGITSEQLISTYEAGTTPSKSLDIRPPPR